MLVRPPHGGSAQGAAHPPAPGGARRDAAPSTRWLPASVIAGKYAVREDALLRYSRRGMLAARWDATLGDWLFDIGRVVELFLHREQTVAVPPGGSYGRLGEAALAGGPRRNRASREPSPGVDLSGAAAPGEQRVG